MRFIGKSGSFEPHFFGLEKDFEKHLYRFSGELFRSANLTRWAPLLRCSLTDEGVKPDSLLINHDETEWWVVEVELGRKSKISDMYDQLGKLSRVNFVNYREELVKGLKDIGYSEEKSMKLGKIFVAQKPNFLLIVDNKLDEMINKASERGFSTLVVKTFKNSSGQIRVALEEETSLTKEPLPVVDPVEVIDCKTGENSKKYVSNGIYWHKLDKQSYLCDYNQIIIETRANSFTASVEKLGGSFFLRLPYEQKPVQDIVKGNRIGKLYHDSGDIFRLILDW